jgi:replicative DNA helicase
MIVKHLTESDPRVTLVASLLTDTRSATVFVELVPNDLVKLAAPTHAHDRLVWIAASRLAENGEDISPFAIRGAMEAARSETPTVTAEQLGEIVDDLITVRLSYSRIIELVGEDRARTDCAKAVHAAALGTAIGTAFLQTRSVGPKQAAAALAQTMALVDGQTREADLGIVRTRHGARMRVLSDPDTVARIVIPTGWKSLDAALGGGVGVGDLSMLAAASGAGKSQFTAALARNVLWSVAANALPFGKEEAKAALFERVASRPGQVRCLVIACEAGMPAEAYYRRIMDDMLGATDDKVRRARLEHADLGQVMLHRLAGTQVTIVGVEDVKESTGRPGSRLDAVECIVRTWARAEREQALRRCDDEPLLLVLVDHLQRVQLDEKIAAKQPRTVQVAQISSGLTALARTEQVAIVCCAQLNGRLGHQSAETCSIRESGDAEHDAATVLILDRLDDRTQVSPMRKLASNKELIDLAAATMRISVAKGRHSGGSADVLLVGDLAQGCRITELRADQAETILGQLDGDPLTWVRDQLALSKAPTRRRKGSGAQSDGSGETLF